MDGLGTVGTGFVLCERENGKGGSLGEAGGLTAMGVADR